MATLNIEIDVPIPTGNTLWVDAVNGDDATGVSGRQDRPFLTLEEARDAAASGDTIHVRPGSYATTTSLARDRVNWYGDVGAKITMDSSGGANGIFFNDSDALTYTVGGHFEIELTVSGTASEVQAAVYVNNAAADVVISCKRIDTIAITDTPDSIYGVAGIHGSLYVDVLERISLTGLLGASAVFWTDGPMYVRCPHITSDWSAVTSYSGNTNDEFFVDSQLIESNSDAAATISVVMGVATLRTWIQAQNIINRHANGPALAISGAGKFYLQCEKIQGSGVAAIDVSFGLNGPVEVWITTQKIASFSVILSASAGIIRLTAQEYEDLGGMTSGIVSTPSGGAPPDPVIFLDGGDMELTTGNGIDISGGTIQATGLVINTAADSTSSPVVKSGGSITLNGCTLIAEATQDSISASTAQTVVSSASKCFQEVNANVSVEGDLFYDDATDPSGKVATGNADGTWSWAAPSGGGAVDSVAGRTGDVVITASDLADFNTAALAAAPAETTTTTGALINGATAKTTPVDADFVGLMDSAASNILKKLSWANIKATLKAYFDTLYPNRTRVINTQVGTTYTLAATDDEATTAMVRLSNASAIALTFPENATVPIPVGFKARVKAVGAGQVTVTFAGATAVNSMGGAYKTAGQYAEFDVTKTATDTWAIDGNLTT